MPTADLVTDDSERSTSGRLTDWHRAVVVGLIAYVVTRLCVLAGAGVRASQMAVDARKLAELSGVPAQEPTADPHDHRGAHVVGRTLVPRTHPPRLSGLDPGEHHLRATRGPRRVLPGVSGASPGPPTGSCPVATRSPPSCVNLVLGAVSVVLVGLLARELYGVTVATRAMVLYVVFPGSFVLSFTYSEATLIVLAAACLLFLVREQWWLAGIAAMIGTGTRPNGVGLVAACVVASFLAIRRVARLDVARRGGVVADRVHRIPAVRRSHRRRTWCLVPGPERSVEGRDELRRHRGHQHPRLRHPPVLVADRRTDRAVDGRADRDDLLRVACPAVAGRSPRTARSWSR